MAQGGRAYPTDFRRDALGRICAAEIKTRRHWKQPVHVRVAGRMMLRRLMGRRVSAYSRYVR